MPYEEITADVYRKMVKKLKPLSFRAVKGSKAVVERFCNNDTCELDFEAEESTQKTKEYTEANLV